jgi:4-amino-4-deoxy-L-arabinose transferase-like glycosyltransferase
MLREFNLSRYLIILPLLFALIFLVPQLNKPLIGHHDFTGAFNGIIAKNYLKYGVWELKFGQVGGLVSGIPKPTAYYTHYLPLLPLLIAASFSIFGVSEWAESLVPLIFTLIGVACFYLICQKIWDKKTAILGSMFYVLNPMFIYFGNMPVAEPVVLGLVLLEVYLYLRWLEKPLNKRLFWLCLVLIFHGLVGWPIFYIGLLIVLHSLLLKKFNMKLIIVSAIPFFMIGVQLFHSYILTGSFLGGGLLETLKSRTGGQSLSFGGTDFTPFNYLKQEISWVQAYFTKVVLFLSLLFTVTQVRKLKRDSQDATILVFFLIGVTYLVILAPYAFVHDFLNIYLLPFLALTAALGLIRVTTYFKKKLKINTELLIFILVLSLSFIQSYSFSQALIKSDFNKPGLEMAGILNSLQNSDNQVGLVSPRFESFYGPFIQFYSNHSYGIFNEKDLKQPNLKNYNYLIFIDQDITDQENYQRFLTNYKFDRRGDLTIIKLNEK